MREAVRVVVAQYSDLEMVLRILSDASRWLAAKGIRQWTSGTIPEHLIEDQIRRNEVYLVSLDHQTIGTVTLQWADELFWGSREPDAGYIHRLAIRPQYIGRGFGRTVLSWAEKETLSHGMTFLRLNCPAANEKLREFYESQGFLLQGLIEESRGTACLYEKHLGLPGEK